VVHAAGWLDGEPSGTAARLTLDGAGMVAIGTTISHFALYSETWPVAR